MRPTRWLPFGLLLLLSATFALPSNALASASPACRALLTKDHRGQSLLQQSKHRTILCVAANGSADETTLQSAIDAAPATGGAAIFVAPGTYREVLHIDKPGIHLLGLGSDASKTVVVYDLSAGTSGGTMHSATVNVTSDDFFAENITFANDWNTTHPQLPQGSQALALLVTGDRAVFSRVRLLGNQDTLYTASHCSSSSPTCVPTRQYFSDCYIAGNVDFIFGDGKSVFDHCEIHSTPHSEGFITAQSRHSATQDSGYVFDHCTLTAAFGATNVYLGRPWRPYATVIYLHTKMGSHIQPAGWREWHPGQTDSLNTATYVEYQSSGPGAHPHQRDPHTKFLTPAQAQQYQPVIFLSGSDHWNPITALQQDERTTNKSLRPSGLCERENTRGGKALSSFETSF